MAPMLFDTMMSLKRNSTTAKFDAPVAKKQNRGPLRHHRPTWRPTEAERNQAAPLGGESVDFLLERTIALALEAVGFAEADPCAIQSFRAEVEEYMLHVLGDVRESMLSSRRTQPLPVDFLQSLHSHQLTLTSLLPHLDPPVPPQKSQIVLPTATPASPLEIQHPSLDLILNGSSKQGTRPYIPRHFPAFPSEHTYKATPDLPSTKTDPRTVRELATKEARLGEVALRKLVGAKSDMNTSTSAQNGKGPKSMRARRDDAWKEAMQAVTPALNNGPDTSSDMMEYEQLNNGPAGSEAAAITSSGYLSTSVNAGKQYWRRPATRQGPKSSANSTAI